MAERKATAKWEGSIGEGAGKMALGSGAFEGHYSFKSRFEDGEGANPEELIAAAHAGCFSMAGEGFEIDRIDLTTTGRVPGIDQDDFQRYAEAAKENCPVSKALAGVGEINLEATLAS